MKALPAMLATVVKGNQPTLRAATPLGQQPFTRGYRLAGGSSSLQTRTGYATQGA